MNRQDEANTKNYDRDSKEDLAILDQAVEEVERDMVAFSPEGTAYFDQGSGDQAGVGATSSTTPGPRERTQDHHAERLRLGTAQ